MNTPQSCLLCGAVLLGACTPALAEPDVSANLNLVIRARVDGHNPSYADWRVAVAKTFEGGWNASVGVVGATNNRFFRPPTGGLSATDGATRALNRAALVVQVGRTF